MLFSRFKSTKTRGPLVYRQSVWTRATHWAWAVSLFFLLVSGLQIFNAHPALYLGEQSGFGFDNEIMRVSAETLEEKRVGVTEILGAKIDTTGFLGISGSAERPQTRAFPAWATSPSFQDLATGRIIHFFFAWILVVTLAVWLVASVLNGHLRRDLVPSRADLRNLPRDIVEHARLRFHHARSYNVLQKLSYAAVLFVLLPLMIATGLSMSPGANAIFPFLTEIFGGRQTARTIHFAVMVLLLAFFAVHMAMIFAAGPFNELRSIMTGWYRTDPPDEHREKS